MKNPQRVEQKKQIYPVKGDFYEADAPLKTYSNYRMVLPGRNTSPDNHPLFRKVGLFF